MSFSLLPGDGVLRDHEAPWIAGFTAAEGCFTNSGSKFAFAVAVGSSDERACRRLHEFFGVGSFQRNSRRRPHYQDEAVYHVRSLQDLINVIIPFMDEHLPPSHKRTQYLAWREQLLDYWENHAKRVRPCTIDGCYKNRRAHGLCRHHLYKAGLG